MAFLKRIAEKGRHFEVIVVESGPSNIGHQTAKELAEAGVDTTLITDAAVFGIMARVNKVIIGVHAVMANGGCITHTGGHLIALAAKHYSVPVVVCTGLYKLSPQYPYDQDSVNDLSSPFNILKFEDASFLEDVHVINPAFDYVPPELISLFIVPSGGHSPSYIYRLLADNYDLEDSLN
eukprot:TRINITY_DN11867_c1_g1_i5.p1 TRINITY_DN11867_c1_g1~~TRINITY_DN11867_c1_g1_i5.p1  ORF type:complete len:179 (-),score=51.15 TRINITY_DN11867_c1_g1_i5:14-550(-)